MSPLTDGLPCVAAADRIYGPLADALGLRPTREVLETWLDLAKAQLGEVISNVQVAAVVAAGACDGMGRFAQRLGEMRSDGRTISSPTALLRLGLGELDGAMHAAMLSQRGLAATAGTVRAASRRRTGWQKLAALGAQAAGQPTRAEVDEAFREIQRLKREVRELKRVGARATSARGGE